MYLDALKAYPRFVKALFIRDAAEMNAALCEIRNEYRMKYNLRPEDDRSGLAGAFVHKVLTWAEEHDII